MRVALVHYWLVGMRGGEKVLEALCQIYPQADIFTHAYDPDSISETIKKHRIFTSFVARLPQAARRYKSYLPLMPIALEQLDLRNYDLVISSESGPAKGIIPPPNCLHVCYCHSPMRYIWNMFHDYRNRSGFVTRMMMPPVAHYLRSWDFASSGRVDYFVANSNTVAQRIKKYYRRDALVINPPVDVDAFEVVPQDEIGDFFLLAGELVGYKRPDLAVHAFNKIGRKLIVIGGGEMLSELRRIAGPTVTILGPQPFNVLRHHLARCQALIFPGEEDFGMVPVEAMASGRPVLAYGRGGATETVDPAMSGIFFAEQSVDAIAAVVGSFRPEDFCQKAIVTHAQQFRPEKFAEEFVTLIDHLLPSRHAASRPRHRVLVDGVDVPSSPTSERFEMAISGSRVDVNPPQSP